MLPWDPNGKMGPKKPLPDHVGVVEPKEDVLPKDKETSVPQQVSAAPPAVGLDGMPDVGPALGKQF